MWWMGEHSYKCLSEESQKHVVLLAVTPTLMVSQLLPEFFKKWSLDASSQFLSAFWVICS